MREIDIGGSRPAEKIGLAIVIKLGGEPTTHILTYDALDLLTPTTRMHTLTPNAQAALRRVGTTIEIRVTTDYINVPAGAQIEVHDLTEHPGETVPLSGPLTLVDRDALATWTMAGPVSTAPTMPPVLTAAGRAIDVQIAGLTVTVPNLLSNTNVDGIILHFGIYSGSDLAEEESRTIPWPLSVAQVPVVFVDPEVRLTATLVRDAARTTITLSGFSTLAASQSLIVSVQAATDIAAVAPPRAYTPSIHDRPLVQLTTNTLRDGDPVPLGTGLTDIAIAIGAIAESDDVVLLPALGGIQSIAVALSGTEGYVSRDIASELPVSFAAQLTPETAIIFSVILYSGTLTDGSTIADGVQISALIQSGSGEAIPDTTIQLFGDDTYIAEAPTPVSGGVRGRLYGQSGAIDNADTAQRVAIDGTQHLIAPSDGWRKTDYKQGDILLSARGYNNKEIYELADGALTSILTLPDAVNLPGAITVDHSDVLVAAYDRDRIFRLRDGKWDNGTLPPPNSRRPQGLTMRTVPGPLRLLEAGMASLTVEGAAAPAAQPEQMDTGAATLTAMASALSISPLTSTFTPPVPTFTAGALTALTLQREVLALDRTRGGHIFTHNGTAWDAGLALPAAVNNPGGLAVDGDDILICDSTTFFIYRHHDGAWDADFAAPAGATNLTGLAVDGDDILLLDRRTDRVYRRSEGRWDTGTPTPRAAYSQQGIGVDTNGTIWIVSVQDLFTLSSGGTWARPAQPRIPSTIHPTGLTWFGTDLYVVNSGIQSKFFRWNGSSWDAGTALPMSTSGAGIAVRNVLRPTS